MEALASADASRIGYRIGSHRVGNCGRGATGAERRSRYAVPAESGRGAAWLH